MCFENPTHEEIEDAYVMIEVILTQFTTFKRDIDGIFLVELSFILAVVNLLQTTPYLENCIVQKIDRIIKNNNKAGFKNKCPLEVALKFILAKAGRPY